MCRHLGLAEICLKKAIPKSFRKRDNWEIETPTFEDQHLTEETMQRVLRTVLLALTIISASASVATAGIIIPPGLNPGDQFHLAFVTKNDIANALSSDIDFYNDFVQAEADAGSVTGSLGLTWKALASTDTVAARDNAPVSAPVFLVDFTTRIATGFADLWDGSIENELNVDQDGVERLHTATSTITIWTGSFANGLPYITVSAHRTLGSPLVYVGSTIRTGPRWMEEEPFSPTQNDHGLFALSEPITVPGNAPVPEPASVIVWLSLAMVGVVSANARRKRRSR